MSQRTSIESREGFKREGDHRAGCLSERDPVAFVITDRRKPFDFERRKDGRRGGSTMWWRFVCNDPRCSAVLLVRWDQIAAFINGVDSP